MGGRPVTALAIACFPKHGMDKTVIAAVFRGGFDKLKEACVVLLGGHTVQDPEIKFGYAVTGAVDPGRMWTNAGAKPGDRVLLTKPIGTGVVATAVKNGRAPAALASMAIEAMRTLNKGAAEALIGASLRVHACTDVTGFGLIGHASEVAAASGVTLVVEAKHVPLFEGVHALVRRNRNGGMDSNREHFGEGVHAAAGIGTDLMDLFHDPQTSGGLLVFVAREDADAAMRALHGAGVAAVEIGSVTEPSGMAMALV
jgi:selenide,water dikinase